MELESKDTEKIVGKSMKKQDGKLVHLHLRQLKPYEKNAKIHTEKQVGKIRDSIITFGYKDLIAVDENNVILEGHGRLKALYQIDTTGERKIPCWKITDLNESEKKAYRIAHNKLNLETGFDMDILKEEFYELEGSDNFRDTGFDVKEITNVWEKPEKQMTDVSQHKRELNKLKECPKCGHDLTSPAP